MNNSISDELILKIREVSGLRIGEIDYKKLSDWVVARSALLGLSSASDYLQYLRVTQDLSEDTKLLSELLTTGETFFMRDPGQMELLRRVIFPELIAKNINKKNIRIWAPACSSGEEVYSIIILLNQLLPDYQGWDIDIIGSDINPDFIARAKRASYGSWAFRGCDDDFKNSYFKKNGDSWDLNENIRRRARFLTLDLINGVLPDYSNHLFDIDFILCRNLFIYMNFDAVNVITDKLAECLTPDGILMTAHGELHAYRHSRLRVKIYPESLIYQKEKNIVVQEFNMPLSPHFPELHKVDSRPFVAQVNRLTDSPTQPLLRETIPELMEKAWYLADRARFREALDVYAVILSLDPMLPELHYLHAVIATERGDIDQAKSDLRKTLYLAENFIPAYLELITIYFQENKISLASKSCDQALKILDSMPLSNSVPCLRNSNVSDVKLYLTNIKHKLQNI